MFYKFPLATFMPALSSLVSASLYPTQPTQDTVYYAGGTVLTTWVDDRVSPLLSNMGQVVIQLYTNTDTYLGTLATDVNPLDQSRRLDISRVVVDDGSNFTLRYITDIPYNMTVYSANFSIVVQGDPIPSPSFPLLIGTSRTSISTLVVFRTASTSQRSLPSSAYDPNYFKSASLVISPFTPPISGNITHSSGKNKNKNKNKNSAAGGIDIVKLKFQLVFILWPAMLGVTLAR